MKMQGSPWEFNEYLFTWPVHSGYEIIEIRNPIPENERMYWEGVIPLTDTLEVIRPCRGTKESLWNPLNGKTFLLTELAKLGEGFNKKEVINFALRFGILGIAGHWHGLETYFLNRDPLVFFEHEAKQAARLLRLYQAVQERNLEDLQKRIEAIFFNTSEGAMVNIFIDGTNIYDWPIVKPPVTEEILLRATLFYVCKETNTRLEGRLTMGCAAVTSDFMVLPGVKCDSLLTAAYIQFRDIVTKSHVLKRCKHCGALFVPSKASQVCCPRLPTIPGTNILEDKPACANRAYVRKHRKKQKEKEES